MHFESLQGWLDWQESLHPRKIDLGLERAMQVYHALNLKNEKPLTITVAGTNGKGSCIAFLEAIYRAQGYRVGAYTSPHILQYNERISVDGVPVADSQICAAFERIETVRGDTSLSYFEFGTLAALDIFWHSRLDVQLLEVGLGGRLDAVNIIDTDAAVVTSICIDHCDWLGETREAIGSEKAGIFRSGVPAVIGDPDPPESLLQSANRIKANVFCYGKDFKYNKHAQSWDWVADNNILSKLPLPALKGEHQLLNASAVLQTITTIQRLLPVNESAIRKGLQSVNLSGRYQFIDGYIPVLLDVGHNPQAVRALEKYLQHSYPGRKIHAVFSMMKDKDIKGVVEIMKPLVHDWFITPMLNSRSADEQMIRAAFEFNKVDNVSFGFSSFKETYRAAQTESAQGDLILVFGSFFLVSKFLAGLNQEISVDHDYSR